MSDYISKSALLKNLWDWRLQECPVGVCDEETETYKAICECIDAVKEQPTLDEKEIIRKAFERVLHRLEETKMRYFLSIANTGSEIMDFAYENVGDALDKAIEIVKEECGISE